MGSKGKFEEPKRGSVSLTTLEPQKKLVVNQPVGVNLFINELLNSSFVKI